jgi:hypothetical protein
MDEDDANEAPLESPIKESNLRVATLSKVPPDHVSRRDEPVLDVAGASWVPHVLNLMSSDIDL